MSIISESNPLLRRLGKLERMNFLLDRACSMNFCFAVEMEGPLNEELLSRAFSRSQERHPLLRARVVVEGRDAFFAGWPDGQVPPIPLRVIDAPPERYAETLEKELNAPFDLGEVPLLRTTLLRHGGDAATLLVTCHHVLGDGLSGIRFVLDVLDSYGRLSEGGDGRFEPLSLSPPIEELLPPRFLGLRGLWKLSREDRLMRAEIRKGGGVAAIRNDEEAPYQSRKIRALPLRLDREETRALVRSSRENGVTVHSALCAALGLALEGELDHEGSRRAIFGPLDIREKLVPPVGEDLGFYVSGLTFPSDFTPDDGLWTNARSFLERFRAVVERDAPYLYVRGLALQSGSSLLFPANEKGVKRLADMFLKRVASSITSGISNLGRLPTPNRVGPLEVRAVHFAASPSLIAKCAGAVATHDDKLSFSFTYCTPCIERDRARELVARMKDELLDAIG